MNLSHTLRQALPWTVFLCTSASIIVALPPTPPPSTSPQPTDFQVHYIDVGSGDCIWIHTGDDGIPGNGRLEGYDILIDGGDAPMFGHVNGYETAVAYLTEDDRLPVGSTIDWMILSHAHADHCGGLDDFLDDYEVLNILDPGANPLNSDEVSLTQVQNSVYGKFFMKASTEIVDGKKANYHWGIPDDLEIDWGEELQVQVLHSSATIVGDHLNDTSIVFSVGFTDPADGPTFLFTGDAEEDAEAEMVLEHGAALKADVLKAGHHGSKTSSTQAFLEAVQPQHVVISSGNRKFSGTRLPSEETLTRIQQVSDSMALGTTIWRTDRDDKHPTLIPEREEAGDDGVVAWVVNGALQIQYVDQLASDEAFDLTRCQATTLAGTQCKRVRPHGEDFCWQHD